MRLKITRTALDKHANDGPEPELWDTECRGFYARFRGRDRSVWRYAFKYRIGGKVRYHAIAEDGGAIPPEIAEHLGLTPGATWTPEAARREAERIRGQVRDGKDPDSGRAIPTLRTFAELYLKDHARPNKKARSVKEDEGLLERHLLEAFGDQRLDRIDAASVNGFKNDLKAKPITANRALALLSHLYTKAQEWGKVPALMNPARGVPRFREKPRKARFLSPEELRRLGAAIGALEREGEVSRHALGAIRLLVLTGARPSEVLSLTWPMVDLKLGLLNLPDSKTGAKTIRLSPPAAQVLDRLPRLKGDPRVFPPVKRKAIEADLESAWRRVRDRAKLKDVRLYDAARHSFASIAVSGGASLYLVGGLLGHKKPSTTQRYAHLAEDPLRALGDQVGTTIAAAMAPKRKRRRGGNVVSLRSRRRR